MRRNLAMLSVVLRRQHTTQPQPRPHHHRTRKLDTRPAPGSVTRSQILNQALPTGTCSWIGEDIGLRLRNGVVRGEQILAGSITVNQVVQQDLDGDGLDDAAYVIECWGGGTNVDYEILIHRAGGAAVRFSERELYTTSQTDPYNSVGFVEGMRLDDRTVIVEWSGRTRGDSNCCASLSFETGFRLSGSPSISYTNQLQPETDRVVNTGDSLCSETRMGRDLNCQLRGADRRSALRQRLGVHRLL